MSSHDIVVIGGGLSGLSVAVHAARAGRGVAVVEAEPRVGGCLHTHRRAAAGGFWLELGAHTCYSSYGAFLELLETLDLLGELQPRGRSVLRFLGGDQVLPGKNLLGLLRRMSLWELLAALPGALGARPDGKTVQEHYARLVGAGNYAAVLGPMLSAVPSQSADGFPADMLFKKRPRRKDVPRSFTLKGGLGSFAERAAAVPGITVLHGRPAITVEPAGGGYAVTLADGERLEGERLAFATPPRAAARLLGGVLPAAASCIAGLGEAVVESLGVIVRADQVTVPYATFLIPRGDLFHSVVTRDVVPDPSWRGFVFHFKPGHSEEEKLARVTAVLGVPRSALAETVERRTVLPAPALGHHEAIRALDAALAGTRVAVTGNWFAGLAIEDCAQRSRAEWRRLA